MATVRKLLEAIKDDLICAENTYVFFGEVLAKIDLKNAFNLLSREQVLLEIATHFPSIYRWVKCMLGSASYLNWSDEVIESAIGVQQGDPLALVLFCVVFKKVINAISDSCALDINLGSWTMGLSWAPHRKSVVL